MPKRGVQREEEEELTVDDFKNVVIQRTGEQIIIPEDMPYSVARQWLDRREREEEQLVGINEVIVAYPLDGAHAFALALAEKFGYVAASSGMSFFGAKPPTTISVDISLTETMPVPWGEFEVPGVDGRLMTSIGRKDYRPCFVIGGEVKRKHRHIVDDIARLTRKIVLERSLYRGKAIRMNFPDTNDRNFDMSQDMPKFIDTSGATPDKLIFSQSVMEQIETSIFTPIKKTDRVRRLGVPLKRGVLLAGPYGTGKTLTANATAYLAVRNGWTFIDLKNPEQLADAIAFARQLGGPSVIFGEDGDRFTEDRDDEMNQMLNTIDGIDAKTSEIMVVLTTNHVEKIDQVMLRPGRLDAVIIVTPPDANAAVRLVKLYAGDLLDTSENLTEVGIALDGKIPAVIREIVERSKLAAISRVDDHESVTLKAVDLLVAARGMEQHLALLAERPEEERSDKVRAAKVLAGAIIDAAAGITASASIQGANGRRDAHHEA